MTAAVAIALGVVFLTVGILAYAGRWRGWATPGRGWYAPAFGMLYVGIAMLLAGLLVTVVDTAPRGLVVTGIVLMTTSFGVGILSLIWLPAFMTPRWFRERRSSGDGAPRWGGRS